jgi:hypothetical protein
MTNHARHRPEPIVITSLKAGNRKIADAGKIKTLRETRADGHELFSHICDREDLSDTVGPGSRMSVLYPWMPTPAHACR